METVTNPYDKQREITKLCIKTAQLLLQYGAESAVIVQLTYRLGIALGMESVECALMPNAITLTTLYKGHCITTTRQNADKGINMHVVTEVQHIVITAEHKIYELEEVKDRLEKIKPLKYNRTLVVVMVGLSCAAFSHLAGGDIIIAAITFVAASIAMFVRQSLSKRHYNPIIVFTITAFIASIIAGMAQRYNLGNDPQIALASSVLLLVPGFPLINSLADILKGFINMGLARWTIATTLTFGACLGIVFAVSLLQIGNWGV